MWTPFPFDDSESRGPMLYRRSEMSGKDEGGQAQCVAILIAAILTMLAELTFILLPVCRSLHRAVLTTQTRISERS